MVGALAPCRLQPNQVKIPALLGGFFFTMLNAETVSK